MAIETVDTIIKRIKVATPKSQIMVVDTFSLGKPALSALFASTVKSQWRIRSGKSYVGLYDNTMDLEAIRHELNARLFKTKGH